MRLSKKKRIELLEIEVVALKSQLSRVQSSLEIIALTKATKEKAAPKTTAKEKI